LKRETLSLRRKRKKALKRIAEIINFDFFGKVFWKMNELQKKQAELNRQLEKARQERK